MSASSLSEPDRSRTAFKSAVGFLEDLGATSLSAIELSEVGNGRFSSAYKMRVSVDAGREHVLAIAFPEGFPFVAPRVAVLDAPPILTWPHLEEGKLLCVLPPEASADPRAPVEQVKGLLNDAVRLMQDILDERLDSDFDLEFTAYWERGASPGVQRFKSLLAPVGTHRKVCIWRGQSFNVVAENTDDLRNWLINGYGRKRAAKMKISETLFLEAKASIRPADYPSNTADLRRIFEGDEEALTLLSKQVLSESARDIIIAVPTPTGTGFAAISIVPSSNRLGDKGAGDKLWRGFRRGRMPHNIQVLRATSREIKVRRHSVDRVDHGWVHGRDHDPRQEILKNAKVLVVGCGSLGSSVAELLARAGVGQLSLIDGETLSWPNISRHALGADNVGNPKASALARRLTEAFPHHEAVIAMDQPLTLATSDSLLGHDLVITTTGTWSVDCLVNEIQQTGKIRLVLYSWLEPHAAAAHAVSIPFSHACLQCHMSSTGVPELTVSQWGGGGAVPVPSCAGTFAPYGAAELAFAHALVAEQALDALLGSLHHSTHATWIGRTAIWKELGGKINPVWRHRIGDPGEGGMVIVRPWEKVATCPICGTQIT